MGRLINRITKLLRRVTPLRCDICGASTPDVVHDECFRMSLCFECHAKMMAEMNPEEVPITVDFEWTGGAA